MRNRVAWLAVVAVGTLALTTSRAAHADAAAPPAGAPAMTGEPPRAEPPAKPAEATVPPETPAADEERPVLGHAGQFGLFLQVGTGYRVLFPYDGEYCGQLDTDGSTRAVCTGRAPTFLDTGLSFGAGDALEVIGGVRLGLEHDYSGPTGHVGPRVFALALGVRIYLVPDGAVKFFTSFEGVIETTNYKDTANISGTDFGVRNTNGVLFDLQRNVGIYIHFGETVTFKNWLRFELDGGLGVQVRLP